MIRAVLFSRFIRDFRCFGRYLCRGINISRARIIIWGGLVSLVFPLISNLIGKLVKPISVIVASRIIEIALIWDVSRPAAACRFPAHQIIRETTRRL